jgi:hypothetical protein
MMTIENVKLIVKVKVNNVDKSSIFISEAK